MSAALVIWQLGDGKPGHENQSLGLIEALDRRVPVEHHRIALGGNGLLGRLRTAFHHAKSLPRPDLIVGAGHATHLPLLALTLRTRARGIVLMKPSLPCGLFDLCLVPRHDLRGTPADHVVPTTGALNRVRPPAGSTGGGRLVLLGGPSSSHGWDAEAVLEALADITADGGDWVITDSRRTPATTREAVTNRLGHAAFFPHEETSGTWLPGRLADAGEIWVTEDSVSMLYEALSSGGKVGLLPVPRKKNGRVARGIDGLIADGLVTPYERWKPTRVLPDGAPVLREADRCAAIILERWFPQAK